MILVHLHSVVRSLTVPWVRIPSDYQVRLQQTLHTIYQWYYFRHPCAKRTRQVNLWRFERITRCFIVPKRVNATHRQVVVPLCRGVMAWATPSSQDRAYFGVMLDSEVLIDTFTEDKGSQREAIRRLREESSCFFSSHLFHSLVTTRQRDEEKEEEGFRKGANQRHACHTLTKIDDVDNNNAFSFYFSPVTDSFSKFSDQLTQKWFHNLSDNRMGNFNTKQSQKYAIFLISVILLSLSLETSPVQCRGNPTTAKDEFVESRTKRKEGHRLEDEAARPHVHVDRWTPKTWGARR